VQAETCRTDNRDNKEKSIKQDKERSDERMLLDTSEVPRKAIDPFRTSSFHP